MIADDGLHVLIVEDNEVNALVLTAMLEHLGHTWTHARHGEEGVHAFSQDGFDLILMDCHMPVLDGPSATARIRRLEGAGDLERTPVVMVTADLTDENRERCRRADADYFMAKPVQLEELERVIERTRTCSISVVRTTGEFTRPPLSAKG